MDGNLKENTIPNERIDLSTLSVGTHTVRFPNFKKIEFEIVVPKADSPKWLDHYNTWSINQCSHQWDSLKQPNGIVGLDFTVISQETKETTKESVLERWSKAHLLGSKQINENNIAIKVLSNIK